MCVQSQESTPHEAICLPYGIVSLLDMLVEKSEYFVTVGRMFEGSMFGIRGVVSPEAVLRPVDFDELLQQWQELEIECTKMEMKLTADGIRQAITHFRKFRPQVTYGMVTIRTGELYRLFIGEFREQRFFRLLPGRVNYYSLPEAEDGLASSFGQNVANKFPDAVYDIREAGRCLALERDTACVLHLMRVLEIGLHHLADRFDVSFERSNWNKIIDQIESAIRQISMASTKPPNWKEDEERFAGIAKEFRYFKDAWRNNANHGRSRYDFEEAEVIYRHVRLFMGELAQELQ